MMVMTLTTDNQNQTQALTLRTSQVSKRCHKSKIPIWILSSDLDWGLGMGNGDWGMGIGDWEMGMEIESIPGSQEMTV